MLQIWVTLSSALITNWRINIAYQMTAGQMPSALFLADA